ncbi:hypothetical protein ACFWUP_12725 [Nocardia sp. NPDC058658]
MRIQRTADVWEAIANSPEEEQQLRAWVEILDETGSSDEDGPDTE